MCCRPQLRPCATISNLPLFWRPVPDPPSLAMSEFEPVSELKTLETRNSSETLCPQQPKLRQNGTRVLTKLNPRAPNKIKPRTFHHHHHQELMTTGCQHPSIVTLTYSLYEDNASVPKHCNHGHLEKAEPRRHSWQIPSRPNSSLLFLCWLRRFRL